MGTDPGSCGPAFKSALTKIDDRLTRIVIDLDGIEVEGETRALRYVPLSAVRPICQNPCIIAWKNPCPLTSRAQTTRVRALEVVIQQCSSALAASIGVLSKPCRRKSCLWHQRFCPCCNDTLLLLLLCVLCDGVASAGPLSIDAAVALVHTFVAAL